MDKNTPPSIEEIFQSLPTYEDEDDEDVRVSGARTVFDYRVRRKKTGSTQSATNSGFEDLGLSDASLSTVRENVRKGLEKFAGKEKFHVWMSDILNQQLNNAVRTDPPDSKWIIQVLFFGTNLTPFILTLFHCDNPPNGEQRETMRDFSRTTARLLMSSLMNFCHTEFFLVPSALPYCSRKFDDKELREDLEEQMSIASEFYGGPEKLSSAAFQELTQAMNYVMRSTTVPCALSLSPADRNEDWLLLLDTVWHIAMVHLLNILEGTIQQQTRVSHHLRYKPDKRTKVIITVLEVARRLSFKHKVTVVSAKQDIVKAIERLAKELKKNHGLEQWLSSLSEESFEAKEGDPEFSEIVIAVDAPNLKYSARVKLTVTEATSDPIKQNGFPFRKQPSETIRLLLVGKTGGGRSATANTLLGENVFRTKLSFSRVTCECETHSRVNEGKLIEVTEFPGFDGDPLFSSDYSARQLTTYDAVCYIIKIDRFTDKDKTTFQNVKTLLGENVVRHIIVIFTCGDIPEKELSLSEGTENHVGTKELFDLKARGLSPTPQLAKMLEECGMRYVVFDNTSKDKAAQIRRFFAMFFELRDSLPEGNKTFTCPSFKKGRH